MGAAGQGGWGLAVPASPPPPPRPPDWVGEHGPPALSGGPSLEFMGEPPALGAPAAYGGPEDGLLARHRSYRRQACAIEPIDVRAAC